MLSIFIFHLSSFEYSCNKFIYIDGIKCSLYSAAIQRVLFCYSCFDYTPIPHIFDFTSLYCRFDSQKCCLKCIKQLQFDEFKQWIQLYKIKEISNIDLQTRQTWVCLGCYNKNIPNKQVIFCISLILFHFDLIWCIVVYKRYDGMQIIVHPSPHIIIIKKQDIIIIYWMNGKNKLRKDLY